MKGKYMENPDYIINCYKKGKLVKDIEIQMDEEIFKNQIKEGFLNYLDVNSGEVEIINLNQFDYYKIKDLRIEEKKIPEKLKIEQDTPSSNYYIRNENGTKCGLTKHSKMIAETLNQVIDYLNAKENKYEKNN